jgi:hypothetical protein
MTPPGVSGQGPAPVLVTRLGGQQRIFPVGTQVRVGRDPTLELVSVNPLVSRQCHGIITSDHGGATYLGQSRRGTFLDGKQRRGPLRITGSNSPYLTVELTTGPSSPVVPRYRARPVTLDGYLDLPVVQIYAADDGSVVTLPGGGLPQTAADTASGCLRYELTADQLGITALPARTYQVQLLAGPGLTPVSAVADLDVTTPPTGGGAPSGAST